LPAGLEKGKKTMAHFRLYKSGSVAHVEAFIIETTPQEMNA